MEDVEKFKAMYKLLFVSSIIVAIMILWIIVTIVTIVNL